MFNKNRPVALVLLAVLFVYNLAPAAFSQETPSKKCTYPDYCSEYTGGDKFEKFNRKMFNFNSKLNKYALRPLHVVWASVMPKYGMDRIQSMYNNIEYPKRLVSTLLQKDFKGAKTETLRFLTNTTIGLGGMFDPARRYFKMEQKNEDIEQALCKCKVKRGPFLVLPVINATTPRALAGRIIEAGLDPTTYVASPITALIKMGLFVNKTSFMQPLSVYMERTYADPYDMTRKLFGMENYIKNNNLDQREILDVESKIIEEAAIEPQGELLTSTEGTATLLTDEAAKIENEEIKKEIQEKELLHVSEDGSTGASADVKEKIAADETLKGGTYTDDTLLKEAITGKDDLAPDIILKDFNPQTPVVDSMRTALFDLPGIDESIWSELSIWNRSFQKRIRTSYIELTPEREKYRFGYIMQKDKSSPVAILYPSIGEGTMSHHSIVLAKLFYDAGYSVIIQGSHFHWEFIKSMPEDYRPGIPSIDADKLKVATRKILDKMEEKYETKFRKKVLLGTSFGAVTTLFIADKENKENTLGIDEYISINPPVELMYALKVLDKNNNEWNNNKGDLKHKTAVTAAKILDLLKQKDEPGFKFTGLPFSDYEGKLITGFILRQKLSDIIFTIEKKKNTDMAALYNTINNMSFNDYAVKYLLDKGKSIEDISYGASLHSISNFLKNSSNYKIYHTIDDYFANKAQLKKLKEYTGKKTVLISNGGHLGFLYRQEFIDELKKQIALK